MNQPIGYVKNRTKQLSVLKSKRVRNREEMTNYRPKLPPKWVDKLEETRDLISRVGSVMQQIESLKNQKSVGLQKQQLDIQGQLKLDMALQMIRDIEENMQNMEIDDCENEEDYRMKQNGKVCLGISLRDVTPQLRTYQREMLQQVQMERPNTMSCLDLEGEYIEQLILDRNERIKHLGEKIKSMSELFREMNRMVIEQGTLLDRIDFNLEQVLVVVRKGKQSLVQANEKQEVSSRAQKCICILVGLNVLCVLIFVLRHTLL